MSGSCTHSPSSQVSRLATSKGIHLDSWYRSIEAITLCSDMNNPLQVLFKKWPDRLVTLQHLVLFRDTLIYFSYYRIINWIDKSKESNLFGTASLLLYHALRTSTCQNSSAWLDSNQRPVLIHTFTVSFTIIVSTDLPLNYTQIKMVGAVGLAPT